jgi:hypothetical protein
VAHKLTFDTVRTASDALPLDEFARNVERYAGQVAVVRGRMVPGTPHRGAAYEMFVTNDMNTRQDGLLFLADRELATQFNELETERQSLPARITVRVGKRGTDGTTPVRITHIDFIGAGSRITRSIPSAEESDDPLVMLNRKPEKYVGQRVVVLGLLSPSVSGPPKEPELSVLFLSEQRPEHLHFTTTPEMAAKLSDAKTPHGFYIAKLTLHVEDKELDGVGPRIVNVVKMELLDRRGEPFKTIE